MSIPKTIHYCWFGANPLSRLAQKCIASWKKYLPEYRIILWNEYNFDTSAFCFTEEAARSKKWAFVADFVRIYALYHYGGIYLDCDVEVKKNLDCFLNHQFFTGFELPNYPVVTALMGAEAHHPWLKELLDYYLARHFIKSDGTPDLTTNTVILTESLKKRYAVNLNNTKQLLDDGICIYPQEYFCPLTIRGGNKQKYVDNAYAVHWFSASWLSPQARLKLKIINILRRLHLLNFVRRVVVRKS